MPQTISNISHNCAKSPNTIHLHMSKGLHKYRYGIALYGLRPLVLMTLVLDGEVIAAFSFVLFVVRLFFIGIMFYGCNPI